MSPLARWRFEKKLLVERRDAALGVAGRLAAAEDAYAAAHALFFAGMKARGFTIAQALRLWRAPTSRP